MSTASKIQWIITGPSARRKHIPFRGGEGGLLVTQCGMSNRLDRWRRLRLVEVSDLELCARCQQEALEDLQF